MFEVLLSANTENTKILKKTARVIFGIGPLKKGNGHKGNTDKFVIPRIDIRNYGPGTQTGVTFTLPEFDWFLSSIASDAETSLFSGYKDLIMTRIRKNNTISIGSIENDRMYGLVLDQNEIKKLSGNVEFLSFLLKYRSATGEVLNNITKAIYTSIVIEGIEEHMSFQCDECIAEEPNMDSHYCKKDFRILRERAEILEAVLNKPETDGKFVSLFQKVMDILHIKKYDRTEQMNVFWPKIKGDKNLLEDEIRHHIDSTEGLTNTINKVMKAVPKEKTDTPLNNNN